MATVSGIEPRQLGLLVTVVGGHERLSVRNLTQKTVVLYGDGGRPRLRLPPGRSGSMADPRIGSTGPPPERGEFVKNWRIAGTADGRPFQIVGFLGYRTPAGEEQDGGVAAAWAVAVVVAIGALAGMVALALPLRRRKGEG